MLSSMLFYAVIATILCCFYAVIMLSLLIGPKAPRSPGVKNVTFDYKNTHTIYHFINNNIIIISINIIIISIIIIS